MFRGGAAVLLAATLVSGGVTVGAGVAGAQSSGDGCGLFVLGSDCPDYAYVDKDVAHDGFEIGYRYQQNARIDVPTTYTITVRSEGDPDRAITRLIHDAPPGFDLKTVTTSRVRPDAGENPEQFDPITLDHRMDPDTGHLVISGGAGTPIPVGGGLRFEVAYTPTFGYSSNWVPGAEPEPGTNGIVLEGPGFTSPTPLLPPVVTSVYEGLSIPIEVLPAALLGAAVAGSVDPVLNAADEPTAEGS